MTTSGVSPCAKRATLDKRNHRLRAGADGRSGRRRTLAGGADRVGRLIAHGVGCDRTDRGLLRGRSHGARHRVGGLRTAGRAAGGADIDVLQRLRILPVGRRDLHDHVILVARDIDGRDLALAEGVIQRVVDLADGDAEAGGGVAIDDEIGLQGPVLLVAVDVGQRRIGLKRGDEFRRSIRSARRASSPCSVY